MSTDGQSRGQAQGRLRERWLRVQALHVATMLPEDRLEAQRVLDYAQSLLTEYIENEKDNLKVVRHD